MIVTCSNRNTSPNAQLFTVIWCTLANTTNMYWKEVLFVLIQKFNRKMQWAITTTQNTSY